MASKTTAPGTPQGKVIEERREKCLREMISYYHQTSQIRADYEELEKDRKK